MFPRGIPDCPAAVAAGSGQARPVPDLAVRSRIAHDRDERGRPGVPPDFRQIDQAAARDLAAGHSLLAYPEGTTSPDGAIGGFKDGAFIIAIASQVPIVTAAIYGTCRIWPPGRTAIHAGRLRVVVAGSLQTTGLTQHDVARLREQARDAICLAHRDLVTAMSAPTAS